MKVLMALKNLKKFYERVYEPFTTHNGRVARNFLRRGTRVPTGGDHPSKKFSLRKNADICTPLQTSFFGRGGS
jgi:hypothetical protein